MASENEGTSADEVVEGPKEETTEHSPTTTGQRTHKSPYLRKKQPEVLCNCPQKCNERIPLDVREGLFKEFHQLGDHYKQNVYLQSYIEMRSVYKRLWCQEERVGGRLQRRVSCKYKVPLKVPDLSDTVGLEPEHRPPKLSTNSKGKMTYIVGAKSSIKTAEVCQKAFMNVYGITEKRIRLQREKLITQLRNDTLESIGANPTTLKSQPTQTVAKEIPPPPALIPLEPMDSISYDISLVNNFFQNQLWKPEYIGISNEALTPAVESNGIKA